MARKKHFLESCRRIFVKILFAKLASPLHFLPFMRVPDMANISDKHGSKLFFVVGRNLAPWSKFLREKNVVDAM